MSNELENESIILIDEQRKSSFNQDTQKLANSVKEFVENFYPAYTVFDIEHISLEKSWDFLREFMFYKIIDCTINKTDDVFKFFAEKMQKFFMTAYALKRAVCYGIISYAGKTSLVIGLQKSSDVVPKRIIEGLFPGINLEEFKDFDVTKYNSLGHSFDEKTEKDRYVGCISGIPALKIDGEYLPKDISSLMRSLNGENYTVMVVCKPLKSDVIQNKIDIATRIHDDSFAVSKRTLSYSSGDSVGTTRTETHTESDGTTVTETKTCGMNGVLHGAAAGAGIGFVAGTIIPGAGNVAGAVGGAILGGLVALITGINFSKSKSKSESRTVSDGYSDAVSKTINENESISGEIQNGFALELMKMCENIMERCKTGRNIGMWETMVSYSSESEIASDIIKGSVYSEMTSRVPEVLPPLIFSYKDSFYKDGVKDFRKIHNQHLLLPENFLKNDSSKLTSFVTSEELCGICTIPTDTTVGFAVYKSKDYQLDCFNEEDSTPIGKICEFNRPVENAFFALSNEDLNKHTFVCGITGSGKTNTVKKILESVNVPFLVLEPAKKEYRNLKIESSHVYSLGRTELNCLRMNPFYIMQGVSLQQHIDLLKDLFSVSFSFYGPMPYIMEKCLNNIYLKKGWNLTLGIHPYFSNNSSVEKIFTKNSLKEFYENPTHKYLFPTMQDLKEEINRYVELEMPYEGEVKGNIRGALQARIESLCISSKGYIFNTFQPLNVDDMLKESAVIELEGLADDSDKAFALGLLIIYINEARAVEKELNDSKDLKHILVIEEAHRLLTKVSTEKNEDLGNPKGKAVEHFTNLLAEMRSYGQGVIIAEQIPTKLAPEVIKNTSNKIVHRLVAKDDQEIMANTVGIELENAIYLGGLKTGYSICHKEGMLQPVSVRIEEIKSQNSKNDASLYFENLDSRMCALSKTIIETHFADKLFLYANKTLVSILYEINSDDLFNGLEHTIKDIKHGIKIDAIHIISSNEEIKEIIKEILYENILGLLTRGVFTIGSLPNQTIINLLRKIIVESANNEQLEKLRTELEKFFYKKTREKAIETVAALLSDSYQKGIYMVDKCNAYLLKDNSSFCNEVVDFLNSAMGGIN